MKQSIESKGAHLVLFLPDDALRAGDFDWRGPLERVFPGVVSIDYAEIAAHDDENARREALEGAIRSTAGAGFVIIDPPEDLDELRWIDEVCLELFGRRRKQRPKAIFFTPPAQRGKDEGADPLSGYRESLRPLYAYYRRDRRAFSFAKFRPRAVRKALKLSKKSKSPIRWGLLLPMGGFLVALLLVVFVFRDTLLRIGAVSGGQSIFGAKVDVGGLGTNFEPELRMSGVAVADREAPMSNLFEFESLVADIDLFALLSGQVHIGEATLSGLELDTERSESGAIEELEEEDEEPSQFQIEMERRLGQVVDDLQNAMEPPKVDELETTQVAQDIAAEARQRLESLQQSSSPDAWKARFSSTRTQLASLLDDPLPSSLTELRDGLSGLNELGSVDIEGLQSQLASVAGLDFENEKGLLAKAQERVEGARSDVDTVRSTLRRAESIKKLDFVTIAKLPGLLKDVEGAIDQAQAAERKLSKARELTQRVASDLPKAQKKSAAEVRALRSSLAEARKNAKEAGDVGQQLSGLSSLFETAKKDVLERKNAVRSARDRVVDEAAALQSDVQALRTQMRSDIAFFGEARERLEAAAERDIASLEKRYSLEAIDTDQILATLVGETAFGWLDKGRSLYRRLSPPTAEGPPKKRGDEFGTTFEFPLRAEAAAEDSEPGFHLEAADFDGIFSFGGRPLDLTGSAQSVSSNPAALGEDATMEFNAERAGEAVSGSARFSTDNVLSLNLAASDFQIEDLPFEMQYAPERVDKGLLDMNLAAHFDGDSVRAEIDLSLRDLVVLAGSFADLDPRIEQVLSTVYSSFDSLEARLELEASGTGIQSLRVKSDALDSVRNAVQGAVGEQIKELRAQAENELTGRLTEQREKALTAIEGFAPEARALVDSLTTEGDAAEKLLSGDKKAVRKLFSSALDLPVFGEDGQSVRAAMEERLGALTTELDGEQARLDSAHGAQAAALDAVLGELGVAEGASGGLSQRLRSELQRLLKLK